MAVNRTRVLIGGDEVNIDINKPVSVKFQNLSVADPKKINSDYTDKITIIADQKGNAVFGNANNPMVSTGERFKEDEVSISIGGVEVVRGGRALIASAKGNYEVNVLDGNYDFFNALEGVKLKDLNVARWDFTWTKLFVTDRLTGATANVRTSAIQIPMCEYANPDAILQFRTMTGQGGTDGAVRANCLLPWLRIESIIREGVRNLGFREDADEVFGDNNHPSQQMFFSLIPPENWAGFNEGDRVKIAEWCPDMLFSDLIKEFCAAFGLYIFQVGGAVFFRLIKDFYRNESDAIDWTDKLDVSTFPSVSYATGFAQNNLWGYREFDQSLNNQYAEQVIEDYPMKIDSALLPSTKDYVRSQWLPPQFRRGFVRYTSGNLSELEPFYAQCSVMDISSGGDFTSFLGLKVNTRQVFFACLDYDQYTHPSEGAIFFYALYDAGASAFGSISTYLVPYFRYRNRNVDPEYNVPQNSTGTHDLSPASMVNNYYREIEKGVMEKNQVITAMFNLSVYDVHRIKYGIENGLFARTLPVYVRSLGGMFIVEKINGWIDGRLTSVTLRKL